MFTFSVSFSYQKHFVCILEVQQVNKTFEKLIFFWKPQVFNNVQCFFSSLSFLAQSRLLQIRGIFSNHDHVCALHHIHRKRSITLSIKEMNATSGIFLLT